MFKFFQKNLFSSILYFLIAFFLWDLQFGATRASLHQIRTEEISESIRNVYWLDEGTIYDGISSNVGYYGTLLIVYKIFGFEIFTAKFVRLALHFISLLCLALLLKRTLGAKRAWLPFIAMGLSPTWIYFNTLQASYGIDLQYIPICLYLVMVNDFESRASPVWSALLGLVAMIACLSYPTFLLYLPSLGLIYLNLLYRRRERIGTGGLIRHGLFGLAGFLLPLGTVFLYVSDPGLLIYDQNTRAGVFRGGGRLFLNINAFVLNLLQIIEDLFYRGNSYYFELRGVEFSHLLARLPLLLFFGTGILLVIRDRKRRVFILAALLLILINLVLPNLTGTSFPGLRRATGLLAGIYALFAFAWYYWSQPERGWLARLAALLLCACIPLHHAMVYSDNLAASAHKSKFRNKTWFAQKSGPPESLRTFLDLQEQGVPLQCVDIGGKPIQCFYSRIFGALAGYRAWNGLPPRPVRAYDWKSDKIIELKIEHWESYYFPH